ncbi:MAG: glycosyltransferase, partial [Phycisphaerales bacterium]|nr:glycosyltransferase [Phycisphaerales bacterium]
RLKDHCPEASIRIGGMEDPGSGGIPMDEIHRAHDKGIIEYLGYVADVKQALADCSVYVLPSWYGEGVPHSILEAMATGRPIITTDHRGCRETVAQGRNGLLVPVRDSQALSQAMSAMAEDSGKRADMGKASRALAESRFDAREVATCMLDSLSL